MRNYRRHPPSKWRLDSSVLPGRYGKIDRTIASTRREKDCNHMYSLSQGPCVNLERLGNRAKKYRLAVDKHVDHRLDVVKYSLTLCLRSGRTLPVWYRQPMRYIVVGERDGGLKKDKQPSVHNSTTRKVFAWNHSPKVQNRIRIPWLSHPQWTAIDMHSVDFHQVHSASSGLQS